MDELVGNVDFRLFKDTLTTVSIEFGRRLVTSLEQNLVDPQFLAHHLDRKLVVDLVEILRYDLLLLTDFELQLRLDVFYLLQLVLGNAGRYTLLELPEVLVDVWLELLWDLSDLNPRVRFRHFLQLFVPFHVEVLISALVNPASFLVRRRCNRAPDPPLVLL